jgi:hypothetical protein
MDLSRWSLRSLGHMLGSVLDADLPQALVEGEVRDAFEISESTEELDRALALIRPGASPEKVLQAFAPFFEGGVCLRVRGAETFLTSLFLFGQSFTPPDPQGTPVDFGLRALEMSRVYKMRIDPILTALSIGPFFRLDGASAFAFAVSSDCVFILFDNRPHPWQVFAIEDAYLSARDVFARLGSPRVSVPRGLFK